MQSVPAIHVAPQCCADTRTLCAQLDEPDDDADEGSPQLTWQLVRGAAVTSADAAACRGVAPAYGADEAAVLRGVLEAAAQVGVRCPCLWGAGTSCRQAGPVRGQEL